MAASKSWNIFHNDLKTAFLQGQSYGVDRDVVCQLPPEAGHPPYVAARLKKPAYGMNDAPRRWWNMFDKALCSYGMVPTRADRCCYVVYSIQSREQVREPWKQKTITLWHGTGYQHNLTQWHGTSNILTEPRVRAEVDAAFENKLDPIAGNPATGKSVAGIIHLFCGLSFRTRWNGNGTTSPSQTQEGFPSWFSRLERCDLHRTKNSLDERSSIKIVR